MLVLRQECQLGCLESAFSYLYSCSQKILFIFFLLIHLNLRAKDICLDM